MSNSKSGGNWSKPLMPLNQVDEDLEERDVDDLEASTRDLRIPQQNNNKL